MLDGARRAILSSTPQRKQPGQGGLQIPRRSDGYRTKVLGSLEFCTFKFSLSFSFLLVAVIMAVFGPCMDEPVTSKE